MDRAQQAFIDRIGLAAETDGLSPIAGRLFGLLLLADAPRSLDELAAALGVSKASVSTDARRLLERGVVDRVTHAGDRRDYYELAPDFFARIIRTRVTRWRRMQQLIDDVRDESASLPSAVEKRFASIDAIHAAVIDRVDEALDDWEQKAQNAQKPAAARGVRARSRAGAGRSSSRSSSRSD
jgi:DNA-binding transcriptional regulator GbsR (MarR family)